MEKSFTRINNYLQSKMWLMAPLAITLGIILGDNLSPYRYLAIYIFAFLTFTGSIGMRLADFQRVLKRPLPIFIFIFYAHIILPILGFLISSLFFKGNKDIILGYILLLSGPVAVISFIWSDVYNGDGALSISMIIVDTFVTPILMPIMAKILIGDSININVGGMMSSLCVMVVIPLIIGLSVNEITKGKAKEKAIVYLQPFGKMALFIALILTISKITNTILGLKLKDFSILLVNLGLTITAFTLGYYNQSKKMNEKEKISVSCGVGLRNNTVTLIIATTYYSSVTALPIIAGLLFQQFLASTFCKKLFSHNKKKKATTLQELS